MVVSQSTLSTLQILAAAVGWFVAALLGYMFNLRLERQRREHDRNGTKRQMRALLRRLLAVIDPFFWSFKNLQLNDSLAMYEQFYVRMSDRQAAATLNDREYDSMDDVLTRMGKWSHSFRSIGPSTTRKSVESWTLATRIS